MGANIDGTFEFETGWRVQWRRTLGSLSKVPGIAPPTNSFNGGEVLDAAVHFFQDCWHVKDWLRNDPTLHLKNDPRKYVDETPDLQLCADIANGSKHLRLTSARTGDPTTTIKGGRVSGPVTKMTIDVVIESGGIQYVASDLARDCVHAWERYFSAEGLDPVT